MTEVVTDISSELKEEMSEEIPCDSPEDLCESHHKSPAEWVCTHPKGEGFCSSLQCSPCLADVKFMLKLMRALGRTRLTCRSCGGHFHVRTIVIRRL